MLPFRSNSLAPVSPEHPDIRTDWGWADRIAYL